MLAAENYDVQRLWKAAPWEVAQAALGFGAGMKAALRDGLVAFEQHEHRLPELGRDALIGTLERVPSLVARYHAELLRDGA